MNSLLVKLMLIAALLQLGMSLTEFKTADLVNVCTELKNIRETS